MFEMYSFVIKTAIDLNKSVLDEMIMHALRFNIVIVLELMVEADPINSSEIIKKIFFQFKFSRFFL